MSVKVLGVGCASCHEQYEQAKAAVKSMGLDVEVEYITDLQKVVGYGAMSMKVPRSTVQYRRSSSFDLLKRYLEERADEWNEL